MTEQSNGKSLWEMFELQHKSQMFSGTYSMITTPKMSYSEACNLFVKIKPSFKVLEMIRKYHLEEQVIELIKNTAPLFKSEEAASEFSNAVINRHEDMIDMQKNILGKTLNHFSEESKDDNV